LGTFHRNKADAIIYTRFVSAKYFECILGGWEHFTEIKLMLLFIPDLFQQNILNILYFEIILGSPEGLIITPPPSVEYAN